MHGFNHHHHQPIPPQVGERVLKERDPQLQAAQFVFHVAPFNSIDHLHLHCQALPFSSWWSAAKYQAGTRWCWTFERVRRHVEEGKPIP
jgi:sulfate adenylyltransferase (ADP) / adenylylsulfatase